MQGTFNPSLCILTGTLDLLCSYFYMNSAMVWIFNVPQKSIHLRLVSQDGTTEQQCNCEGVY